MVDEEQDTFASVFDNCCYASSQDELFTQVEFLHEGEKIPDNVNSPDMEDSGASSQELDGTHEIERIHGGESTAADADSARANNLGFAGERQLEEYCGEESEEEPELKKHKVSPSVHCSGKKVIEDEEIVDVPDEGEKKEPKKKILNDANSPAMEDSGASCQELDGTDEIERVHGGESTAVEADSARAKNLGFAGERHLEGCCGDESEEEPELKKHKVSPSVRCSEKKVIEDEEIVDVPHEGEMRGPKKKLEFGGDTEVINVEEEQEKKEVGFGGATEVIDVQEDEIARRKKRELPRSMFGLVWDVGSEYANRDVGDGLKAANIEEDNHKGAADDLLESGSREASVEGNRDCISKDGEQETIKCILEALRLIVSGKFSNDDDDIDVLETAKRCGITFPRSRFLLEIEEDEKFEL